VEAPKAPAWRGGLGHLHALWNHHIKACFFGACFFVHVVIFGVAVRKASLPSILFAAVFVTPLFRNTSLPFSAMLGAVAAF
jgi:hypothetical protein